MQIGYSLIYDKSGEWKEKLIENHKIELNIRTSPQKAFAGQYIKPMSIRTSVHDIKNWAEWEH